MKTATSIDMMTADSFTSPFKNHSESTNFDIVQSMSFAYSSPSSTSGILRLESNEKLRMSRNLISEIDGENPEEQTSLNGKEVLLEEVIEMQRKVKEAFVNFMDNENVIFRNEEKINELAHKNKMKKNECIHVKEMTGLNLNRLSKLKKKLKKRAKLEEATVLNKIEESKERTSALFEEIEQLKYEIKEQKKLQKEIEFLKIQKGLERPMSPYNFSNQQQFVYGSIPPNFPGPHNHFSFMPSGRSKESPETGRSDERNRNMKAGFENTQSPDFGSKKQPAGNNFEQIFGENFIQALQQATSPIAHAAENNKMINNLEGEEKIKKSEKLNGKWENTWEEEEVLSILNTSQCKKMKTIESNQSRNSGNKKLKTGESNESDIQQTPQFLMKQTESDLFSYYHNRNSIELAEKSSNNRKYPNVEMQSKNHIKPPNSIYDQSKVNVEFHESATSLTKFSEHPKSKNLKVPSIINSSAVTMHINDSSQSRSGKASPSNDQASQSRERSFTADQRKNSNNSSFEKIVLEEGSTSEIFSKPLASPPKLVEKRLRKVTEQESDLLESNENKQSKHSHSNSINYLVQDVILDEENMKRSEIMKCSKVMKEKKLKYSDLGEDEKIVLEEESDEDDFMKVNLATVSKISKEKELSERNWKSIDLDEKEKQFNTKNHHILNNSSMPTIVTGAHFHDINEEELKKRKSRKNSGTRFSMILESKYEGLKSQEN